MEVEEPDGVALLRVGPYQGLLPAYCGDAAPELTLVETRADRSQGLWLLVHADLRRSARVRAFVDDFLPRFDAAAIPADDRSELWLDAIKYLFVTSIEACIDVAQHIASSGQYPAPDTNAAAIRLLGARA